MTLRGALLPLTNTRSTNLAKAQPGRGSLPEKIARKMFLSEAHLVGMLQHPHILPIFDAGEENGQCYIVTEHVHGARTLAAYCRPDNLLRIDDVVELIYKAARALHYAHSRGGIHRDIKPSTIMSPPERAVPPTVLGIAVFPRADMPP